MYHGEAKFYRILSLCRTRQETADTERKRKAYEGIADTLQDTLNEELFDVTEDEVVIVTLWSIIAGIGNLFDEIDYFDDACHEQVATLNEVLMELSAIMAFYKTN